MSEQPMSIDDAMRLAMARHRAGLLADAAAIYAQVIAAAPAHADALHMAGVVALQQGDAAQAGQLIRRSLAIRPFAAAYSNLAVALEKSGKADEAVPALRAALALEPANLQVLQQLGRLLCAQAQAAEGVAVLEKLLTLAPQSYEACALHAIALELDNRIDDAIAGYQRAIALQPASIDMRDRLARALLRNHRNDAAIAVFQDALAIQPEATKILGGLGYALIRQRRYAEAEPYLRRAAAQQPDDPLLCSSLVSSLLYQGKQAEATALALHTLKTFPQALHLHSPLLAALACDADSSPEEYLAAARGYGAAATALAAPLRTPWPAAPTPMETPTPLRVGLVSGDLRQHPVGYFLENFIAHLDRQRIELVAYTTLPGEDALTARLKNHIGEWHDISKLLDADAARKIRGDNIHLLIDLAGHTAGNRLPLFAWRPAPVQLTWLGYSASTGVQEMDWLLADAVSVPPQERKLYTEGCWYMPASRICFTAPADAPPVAALPASLRGAVTFATFQNMNKITDRMLALWVRILLAAPDTRLRVQNGELDSESAREIFLARIEKLGVPRARILLAGRMPRVDYLAAHAEADIILDTYPYPGGTTTCEALWMGVPTLTLAGRTLLSRYGASVLHACALDEWIASDEEDYVRKALQHAADINALASLRTALRQRLGESSLCDGQTFARQFADALLGMWQSARA